MKLEKLPSGSYRIRKMYKGQTYTIVFEHKPTQKEAMQAMAAELDKVKCTETQMSFFKAAESYVDLNVMSFHQGLSKNTQKLLDVFLSGFPLFLSLILHRYILINW